MRRKQLTQNELKFTRQTKRVSKPAKTVAKVLPEKDNDAHILDLPSFTAILADREQIAAIRDSINNVPMSRRSISAIDFDHEPLEGILMGMGGSVNGGLNGSSFSHIARSSNYAIAEYIRWYLKVFAAMMTGNAQMRTTADYAVEQSVYDYSTRSSHILSSISLTMVMWTIDRSNATSISDRGYVALAERARLVDTVDITDTYAECVGSINVRRTNLSPLVYLVEALKSAGYMLNIQRTISVPADFCYGRIMSVFTIIRDTRLEAWEQLRLLIPPEALSEAARMVDI